jgi:hypothetical protein
VIINFNKTTIVASLINIRGNPPALSAVARALLMSLQAKVFRKGGIDFAFHTFWRI